MCKRTAWRICRDNQWWSVFGKKRGKNGKRPGPPVHDDLVKRDFSADDVNELWLTDITEHWSDDGKLYLCAIKDVFSGRIVGYSISDRMKAHLAVNALDNAISRRRDTAGCIVHSDTGSQFRSRKFVHALNRHHLVGSMGKVGAAGDNAAMESFFSLLQKNVLDRKRWRTREELRIAITTWIERTYHRRRRQARLGRLTPPSNTRDHHEPGRGPRGLTPRLSPVRAAVPSIGLLRARSRCTCTRTIYSNRIVWYCIDSRMKSRLAAAALNNAIAGRGGVTAYVVHTDRGS